MKLPRLMGGNTTKGLEHLDTFEQNLRSSINDMREGIFNGEDLSHSGQSD